MWGWNDLHKPIFDFYFVVVCVYLGTGINYRMEVERLDESCVPFNLSIFNTEMCFLHLVLQPLCFAL